VSHEKKYPPGTVWTDDGYPRYWSTEYGCWMYPVFWNDRTGDPIYSLQPIQWQLLQLTPLMRMQGEPGATMIGFGGAAGGSKSHCARAIATMVAHAWHGSKTIIFRETEDAVKENHVEKFLLEVPPELYDINMTDLRATWRKTGSTTRFGFLKDANSLKKYQGQDYDCMIFEEYTQYDPKLVSWLVNNRLRSSVEGTTPFALFPTNPGGLGHYEFVRMFVDRDFRAENDERPEDYAFLPAKLSDNYVLQKRDPGYIRRLNRLEEPYRSWYRDGDFRAGAGRAITQLRRDLHLIPFFVPPPHWICFGGFDWGYQHPFSFGFYASNEDGRVFKCDTITGRYLNPPDIADRIVETLFIKGLNHERLAYVASGHDAWAEVKSRGSTEPTIAERLVARGLPLIRANTSRISGLNNLREYLAWENRGPEDPTTGLPTNDDPALVFMDTPGNRQTLQVLETRVPDPLNIEDVLKTDADQFGQGGDDEYDETRYALASRPPRPKSPIREERVSAFSPSALAYDAEQCRRLSPPPVSSTGGVSVIHPEFGDLG
jgi:hypothetical protein